MYGLLLPPIWKRNFPKIVSWFVKFTWVSTDPNLKKKCKKQD